MRLLGGKECNEGAGPIWEALLGHIDRLSIHRLSIHVLISSHDSQRPGSSLTTGAASRLRLQNGELPEAEAGPSSSDLRIYEGRAYSKNLAPGHSTRI